MRDLRIWILRIRPKFMYKNELQFQISIVIRMYPDLTDAYRVNTVSNCTVIFCDWVHCHCYTFFTFLKNHMCIPAWISVVQVFLAS